MNDVNKNVNKKIKIRNECMMHNFVNIRRSIVSNCWLQIKKYCQIKELKLKEIT